jgi:uncharacterized protein (TIGR03083 family)
MRVAYLEAAASAAALLADPAVAAAWQGASALPKLTVGGLAGHLARQVVGARQVLAAAPPDEDPISLTDHYARSSWVGADLDHETNVGVRSRGEQDAAEGAAALVDRVNAALDALRSALPAEPAGRIVHLPWGPWSLSLDDYLVTRMMEIAVHSDDLAVSVGVPTPPLPPAVLDPVLDLLTRIAVRRHGQTAVLRALSRSERAPATISAL